MDNTKELLRTLHAIASGRIKRYVDCGPVLGISASSFGRRLNRLAEMGVVIQREGRARYGRGVEATKPYRVLDFGPFKRGGKK